jgi:transposase
MGKPYSIDLRERVQAEVEGGQSRRGAARRYDVSASFAVKLRSLGDVGTSATLVIDGGHCAPPVLSYLFS